MQFEIITEFKQEFIGEWRALWQRSVGAHFFNSPDWFLASAATFPQQPHLVAVVRDKKKIAALLPLAKKRKFGVLAYCNPAEAFLDKSALLLASYDSYLLRQLLDGASSIGNLFVSEIPQEIATILLSEELKRDTLVLPASLNPYLPMDSDPLRFLSRKQRSKIKNKYRKNRQHLQYYHQRESLHRHLDTCIQLSAESYKTKVKGYRDPFAEQSAVNFLHNLIAIAPASVEVDILSYEGEAMVFAIGFVKANRYYASQTAYLPKFRKLIPGKIELYLLLQQLFAEGFAEFDFGRGYNTFKREFTPRTRQQYLLLSAQKQATLRWWVSVRNMDKRIKSNKLAYGLLCCWRKLHH